MKTEALRQSQEQEFPFFDQLGIAKSGSKLIATKMAMHKNFEKALGRVEQASERNNALEEAITKQQNILAENDKGDLKQVTKTVKARREELKIILDTALQEIILLGESMEDHSEIQTKFLESTDHVVYNLNKYYQETLEKLDLSSMPGVETKHAFDEKIIQELDKFIRYGEKRAIMFLTLSNLTKLEETQGKKLIDQIDRDLSIIFTDKIRSSDSVFRLSKKKDTFPLIFTAGKDSPINFADTPTKKIMKAIAEINLKDDQGQPIKLEANLANVLLTDRTSFNKEFEWFQKKGIEAEYLPNLVKNILEILEQNQLVLASPEPNPDHIGPGKLEKSPYGNIITTQLEAAVRE